MNLPYNLQLIVDPNLLPIHNYMVYVHLTLVTFEPADTCKEMNQ